MRIKDIGEIVENIKDILSLQKDGKIFDADVAEALNMSRTNLALLKHRFVTPIAEVCFFCKKRNISINEFLFKG